MKRKTKIITSVGAIFLGWLINAFAWTTIIGHPVSTICLLLGLGLFFTGLIFLILTLTRGKYVDNRHSAYEFYKRRSLNR